MIPATRTPRHTLTTAGMAVIWLVLAPGSAPGQGIGTVSGRVTEAASGRAVRASVELRQLADTSYRRIDVTDADGRYRFAVVPGRYSLRVLAIGYGGARDTLDVTDGRTTTRDFQLAPVGTLEEMVIGVPLRSANFTLSEPNYFITGRQDFHGTSGVGTTSSLNQVKFRVAVRYRVLSLGRASETGLHVAYRQNSFWHLYEESAPFFDSNYNPQAYLYLDSREYSDNPYAPSVIAQVQHESNGRDGAASRGWNRYGGGLELGDYYKSPAFGRVLVWDAFGIESTNPRIREFAGKGEVMLNLQPFVGRGYRLGDGGLEITARLGGRPFVPSVESNLFVSSRVLERIPTLGWTRLLNASVMGQVFSGTAENLLTFSDRRTVVRLGLATVR